MTPEQNTPEVRAYIEEQKAEIDVPSYETYVTNQAFKGRTAGQWAGIAMGFTWGSIVGVAAATAVALIVPASPMMLAGIVALCSTAGVAVGTLSGQIIGAAAGAVRGGFYEFEHRLKEADLEKALLNDPKLAEKAADAAAARTTDSPLILKPNRSLRIEEMYVRSNGFGDFIKNFVMPKTMAVSSAAGIIIGAVAMVAAMYAGGGYTGLAEILAKDAAGTFAKIAAGSLVGAVSGASFGFNFPAIFTSLSRYAGATLGATIFTKEWWQKDKAKAVALPEKDIPVIFPELKTPETETKLNRNFEAMISAQRTQEQLGLQGR